MTTSYQSEKTENENTSSAISIHNFPLNIKQEVIEAAESEYISGVHLIDAGEFNIKEEILSDTDHLDAYEIGTSKQSHPNIAIPYNNAHFDAHYKAHIKTEVGNEKTLFCTYCTYSTKRRSHLNDHIRCHTGDKPFQCNACEYKSGLKGNLKRHMARIHDQQSPVNPVTKQLTTRLLRCAHCNYVCLTKNLLIRHMKRHTLINIPAVDKYNLRSLSSTNVIKKETLENAIAVGTPEFIDIHELKLDPQGELLTAVKAEPGILTLNEDWMKYLYKCNECNYRCARKTHLNDHLKTHSGEKPFVCVICNYRTGHKSHLTRHLKVHIKREDRVMNNQPLIQPVPVKKQVYRCLLCGYKSQIKHCFAKHMRLHIGVALYTCNICNFQAKSSVEIKQHIKIHNGERQFYCNTCGYKAMSKVRLRRHLLIHNFTR